MSAERWLRFKAGAGRVLLALLVVSALAGVLWYRRLAGVEDQTPPPVPLRDLSAEMVTHDFRHAETRMDRTIWVLESALAEVSDQRARLRTVRVTWYGEAGALPVVITSEVGEMNLKNNNIELSGKVRLERADGASLTTEELWWDEGNTILRAPQHVVVSTPDFTFSGEGLVVNMTMEKAVLFGPVKGEVKAGAAAPARPS